MKGKQILSVCMTQDTLSHNKTPLVIDEMYSSALFCTWGSFKGGCCYALCMQISLLHSQTCFET